MLTPKKVSSRSQTTSPLLKRRFNYASQVVFGAIFTSLAVRTLADIALSVLERIFIRGRRSLNKIYGILNPLLRQEFKAPAGVPKANLL